MPGLGKNSLNSELMSYLEVYTYMQVFIESGMECERVGIKYTAKFSDGDEIKAISNNDHGFVCCSHATV